MIPIAQLDISNPKRATEVQTGRASWYPYYAGFSVQFAQALLMSANLGTASSVIDPWNGSGTTTAAAAGIGSFALGFDLNPVMVLAAKARMLSKRERISLLPLAKAIIDRPVEPGTRFLMDADPLCIWLTRTSASCARRIEIAIRQILLPPGVRVWARDGTKEISDLAAFFYVALFRTIRGLLIPFLPSNPTWVKKPKDLRQRLSPSQKVLNRAFLQQVSAMADAIKTDPFEKDSEVTISIGSSEALPLKDSSADFVLSSPPYCTRIDYAIATLPELAVLGMRADIEVDELRRALIGTSTVPKVAPPKNPRWGPTCLDLLNKIDGHESKASQSYYLKSHLQYFHSMFLSLNELKRILRPAGVCVLVVQDSHYKELHNDLPLIFCEMAEPLGMRLARRVDFRQGRSMAAVNPRIRRYRDKIETTEAVLCFERN